MEEIKIYIRDHNLYDIFYGPFREREQKIPEVYIDMASSEKFRGVLEVTDRLVYFDSHRKEDITADR